MHLKKLLINLLKFGISAGILIFAIVKERNSFSNLLGQPKHWGYFTLACLLLFVSVLFSFYRWYLLVRALDLPFRVRDAMRLGFLGYLLNFASLGSVGGDLFKAVFIAREQHGNRTEAVATVIIDRLIGLYCLLLVGSVGILLFEPPPTVKPITNGFLLVTGVGTLIVALMMLPALSSWRVEQKVGGIRLIGGLLRRIVSAIRMYRDKHTVFVASCVLSIGVHVLTTLSLFCVACGLPGEHPSLNQHFIIVPLSMSTGVLPLPGGLGATEGAMAWLYEQMAGSDKGLIVAFGYRAITVLLAMIGACYYIGSRREVSATMHEAEAEQDQDTATETDNAAISPEAVA